MIAVLLVVIVAFLATGAYVAGGETRKAIDARRAPATPALTAPPRRRSLDRDGNVCPHSSRPAAVVPTTYTAPVAWVCPDCDDVVPEPPALGPAREPDDGSFIHPSMRRPPAGVIADNGIPGPRDRPDVTTGTIRAGQTTLTAGTITANRIHATAVMSTPTTQRAYDDRRAYSDERHSVRQALDAAQERIRAMGDAFETDRNGRLVITNDQHRAYTAACESVNELRAHLAAMPESETYEVRTHQSATPVRTFEHVPAWPSLPEWPTDWRRQNYRTLLIEAGHSPAYVADALAEWDRRQTTAEPTRIALGRGWPADDPCRPL